MNINDLKAMGAFVSTKPIKRVIDVEIPVPVDQSEWADPDIPEFTDEVTKETIDVYFKPVNSSDQIAIAKAVQDDQLFTMVYRLVTKPDGSPLFDSLEQTKTLSDWLAFPLMQAIEDLAPKKSNATQRTSSGSNSASLSEGEAPKNGKNPSASSGKKR